MWCGIKFCKEFLFPIVSAYDSEHETVKIKIAAKINLDHNIHVILHAANAERAS